MPADPCHLYYPPADERNVRGNFVEKKPIDEISGKWKGGLLRNFCGLLHGRAAAAFVMQLLLSPAGEGISQLPGEQSASAASHS